MSLLRSGYYGLSWLGAPFISGYLKWRAFKGQEDKARLPERSGIASLSRPQKSLLWLHAVSVGEAISGLTIIQGILKVYPEIHVLLTTTTASSAEIVKTRLPKNTTHQFCPVDTPQAVKRFLDTWQPDLAVWIESELWPNLIHMTQEKGIPTILLNGRMSPRSFSKWKRFKGLLFPLLSRLDLCAVQSDEQAHFFQTLGAKNVSVMGNVKMMMSPLGIDIDKYNFLKREVGTRPVWLAASTHPGEEEIILKAHKKLLKEMPDLLTILVPRHIERARTLQSLALKEGVSTALRTQATSLKGVDVYIGDTLGEMGLFYALSSVILIGATLVPRGGHNPIEAAQLNAFVLHGPHTFNNPQLYDTLSSLGFSQCIQSVSSLPNLVLSKILREKASFEEPEALKIYREEGLQNLMKMLAPHLTHLRKERE